MTRNRWVALAILPVLLLAGDFFYWRVALRHLREGFDAWARNARSFGWDIRHGAITAGGWPDSATLRVKNLTVITSSGTERGLMTFGTLHLDSLAWGGDAVLLSVGLTRPNVLDVTPVGVGALRLNESPAIPVSAGHLHLRLTVRSNGSPRAVDIEATNLAAEIPGAGILRIGHLDGHAGLKPDAGRDQPAITFSVSARPVTLPAGSHWGLGPEISELALEGGLNGPIPSIAGPAGLAAQARSWRDDGGSLELHRLAIGWGPARLDATATLALDEDLQPMGAGTGKIAGYGAAFDALAADAVLTRSAVQAAKAVLSLLANSPADGEPEEVEVPLTLQFRTLSVRQVPLVRLPEFDWPEH
jgi:hypothetical protein